VSTSTTAAGLDVPRHPPEVSVVVPVFRNADTLPSLAERIRRVFADLGVSYELILVDDASPDESLAVATRLADYDPAIGVVAVGRNVGQHRVVRAGFAMARAARVVLLDADLQDPPEAIPSLLAKLGEGFDAVFAGRVGHYQAFHRMLTSRAYKLLQRLLCRVPREAGMFIAMSRNVVERLLTFAYADQLTVPTMIGLSGVPLTSVPVPRARREHGRSGFSGWKRLRLGATNLVFATRWRLLTPRRHHVAPAPLPVRATFGVCRRPESR
jgi:hypothetical protein